MQGNVNIPDSTITTNLSFRQLVLMNMQQLTNFPYIEKDFDALTDYELLCLVVKFLNDVIANQNEQNASITRMYESFLALQNYVNNTKDELEDAFNNLDDYVRNYFENLDVQDEINNKLDEMLEDGVLEQIIEQFLQSTAVWCFDTVADMKNATNLTNGSYAKTLGFYSLNDGGGATYKIKNTGTANECDIISIGDLNAHLILNNEMNLTQFGVSHTSEDITEIFKYVTELCSENKITLIIPAHTYNFKTLLSSTSGGYTYGFFVRAIANLSIKGSDKYNSVLKVDSSVTSYNSVFFNDTLTNNVVLDNFTIEQYYLNGENMSGRVNRQVAFILYGESNDITIKNMFFKNCCGVNVIAFHDNTLIKNVTVKDNIFDYKEVQNINYYDRSILYFECHDYKILNNTLYGNFQTNGGIECHGYNGICKNNIIYKCATGVNIAPKFADTIVAANIEVSSNEFSDNGNAIKIWNNTQANTTLGCKGIIITNNNIAIDGSVIAQNFWKSNNTRAPLLEISGITTYFTDSAKLFNDIIISNNNIALNNYASYISYESTNATYRSGISFSGNNTMNNIQIVNNNIQGFAGNGIVIGDARSSATNYPTITNVFIMGNIILNCGYSTQNVDNYKAFILLRNGNMNNILIKDNILNKTDNSYNTKYQFLNQKIADNTKTNIYYINNIATSVVSSETEFTIGTGSQHTIIEKGLTAERPAIANIGTQYYDETLNKLIVYNGSSWINVDGTSL